MQILMASLLILLVILAVTVALTKKLFPAVIIFMSYSVINSIIWMLLQSPDLAITEAAVGAGISTVLFVAAFKRMGLFEKAIDEEEAVIVNAPEENIDETDSDLIEEEVQNEEV